MTGPGKPRASPAGNGGGALGDAFSQDVILHPAEGLLNLQSKMSPLKGSYSHVKRVSVSHTNGVA